MRKNKKTGTLKPAAQSSKKKTWFWRATLAISILMAAAGTYILLLIIPTTIYVPSITEDKTITEQEPKLTENRLYIPKIGLSITYAAGGPEVLNEQAWHRHPERGDPVNGGNFILSAHRFRLGFTPGSTIRQSPFYHINKLDPGDKIFVDFEGKRYEYEVAKRFSVKPTQVEIEAPSEEPKLTLYSCTLKGEQDGREVIIAHPI
jgi:sortase A